NIGKTGNTVLKKKGKDNKKKGSGNNRNKGRGNHSFTVIGPGIKPKKGGFHAVGQNHIKYSEPRKNNTYLPKACRFKNLCVERQQQKGQHPGQDRSQTIDKRLFK